MGKYYDAMRRLEPESAHRVRAELVDTDGCEVADVFCSEPRPASKPDSLGAESAEPGRNAASETADGEQPKQAVESEAPRKPAIEIGVPPTSYGTGPLVPVPTAPEVPRALARGSAIRQLTERMAPKAAVDRSCRLAVAGCRPRDGVSSIAAALALDLSQRLSLKTILVDANLRHPVLHRLLVREDRLAPELILGGSTQVQATGWPRLDLATCCVDGDEIQRDRLIGEFENLLRNFDAVVLDIGVPRLDARILPLVRNGDPIVLVVRYGQTEKRELVTTSAALRAAERSVAGVVLNAASLPAATFLRRYRKHE